MSVAVIAVSFVVSAALPASGAAFGAGLACIWIDKMTARWRGYAFWAAGSRGRVDLGGLLQHAALALLLTERGQVLSAERMIDLLLRGSRPCVSSERGFAGGMGVGAAGTMPRLVSRAFGALSGSSTGTHAKAWPLRSAHRASSVVFPLARRCD